MPFVQIMQKSVILNLFIKFKKSDLKPMQNKKSASDIEYLLNADFNILELQNGLETFMKGNSAGHNGILPEFLINLGDSAQLTLQQFINQTWRNGVPSAWRKALIILNLKPHKPADNLRQLPANFFNRLTL